MGSTTQEAKVTLRLTKGQRRTLNALANKYNTSQSKLVVALLKTAKEFPHQIESRL